MKLCIVLLGLLMLNPFAVAADAATARIMSAPVEKDGLEVQVLGDKTLFARNEPIKFTVRLKNVSDKRMSLEDADAFAQWVVRLVDVESKMPWGLQNLPSDQVEPVHEERKLKPGESVDVSTDWGSNRFPFRYESELILNMPIPPADTLQPGRYQLWLGINRTRNLERAGEHRALRGAIHVGPMEIQIDDKEDPHGLQASEGDKQNEAEFQTVTRPQWILPVRGAKSEVQIGLKVTNRSQQSMRMSVFDTAHVVLEDSQGIYLSCKMSRYYTVIPDPLLLQPGESRTIYRNATLEWASDGKSLRLFGSDGAGGTWHFDDLKPNRYKVHFDYEVNDERMKPVLDRIAKSVTDPMHPPFWMGKVTSKELAVEIVEAPK